MRKGKIAAVDGIWQEARPRLELSGPAGVILFPGKPAFRPQRDFARLIWRFPRGPPYVLAQGDGKRYRIVNMHPPAVLQADFRPSCLAITKGAGGKGLFVSGLETAIRQALERSDRASAETRARIYQSARNALEAGLRKQNVHDETMVAQQRHRLELTIHAIEQQERAALKTQDVVDTPRAFADPFARDAATDDRKARSPVDSHRHGDDGIGDMRSDDRRPQKASVDRDFRDAPPRGRSVDGALSGLRADREDAPDNAPVMSPLVAPIRDANRPGARTRDAVNDLGLPGAEPLVPRRRRSRGGRIVSMLMVVAVLTAAIGSAIWWVMSTGLLEQPRTPAAPPPTASAEDFDGSAGLRTLGAQAGFTADWLDLYLPEQGGSVAPAARARVETVRDEGGERLRITSATGDADGNVAIEVPASALERMSGQTSTLALSVQSASGKPIQFSVECDFASLGACGRHRFTVNDEKSDMLFKITFDRTLSPSGPGRILVNSDVGGTGAALDLYAVRLLPGQ